MGLQSSESMAHRSPQHSNSFLGVVLAAWHDGACCQNSQFIFQQVEERDRVIKTIHEQHVVLVGDLRVLCKTANNTTCGSNKGPDFCFGEVACLFLAQQEALDAPSDWLVVYVLLDGEAVISGKHALFDADLLSSV